uniref:PGC-1 and ERR-induced regulator in muscle protein 1 n=1 Tax=Monopterus albus TaxID=43700 RepID=A0A3Q3KL40_MONAL
MDDLDHSMHIAEYDWTSFCEDSEECSLQQPLLACSDSLSLSESEDSTNLCSVFSTGQQEPQQSPDVSSDEAESSYAGCSTEGASCFELLVHLNKSATGGEQDRVSQVESEICLVCPEGNTLSAKEVHMKTAEDITEETNDSRDTPQTEQVHVQCSGVSGVLKREDEDLQIETDHSRNKHDPLFLIQTEVNVNVQHATEGTVSEDVSTVASHAEKERWFVTVNDSPAGWPVAATSVKKKRWQKKPCKNSRICSRRQEKSLEHDLELEINKDKNASEGGRDVRGFTQSKQNLFQSLRQCPSAEIIPESTSDLLQVSCEVDTVPEKQVFSHCPKGHNTEPVVDRNKHEPGSSTSLDTFTPKDPSQLDIVNSDELKDNVEFSSIHTYDSENSLSAAESVEEPQHPLKDHLTEKQQLHSSLSLTTNSPLSNQTDIQHREVYCCDSTPCCSVPATSCGGYESTIVEPTLTFPSAGRRANKTPDNTACNHDTCSAALCMPSDKPVPQKHKINLSASAISSGSLLSPLPVPDLTITPCFMADSPETYGEAVGHMRPVYAISTFWDEMEKLTINDILQLRMSRSASPREIQETVTLNVDDHSSLVDTLEHRLSDSGLMDALDTADSDYFTQPDESKPHRSNSEFSTSDFEEDYWQFIGTSRSTSPDPQGKTQQRMNDSPFFLQEEETSTSSDGKETPVLLEDFAGQCFEDQESHTCKLSDSLGILRPASFLSDTNILDKHYQTAFPEVFEYIFTEDEPENDSGHVTVYDPKDISVSPVSDYTLCTFRDQMSFSPLHDFQCSKEKPVPIFSCTHLMLRELTFPKPDYVFLSADRREENVSPVRVVSRAFTQASGCESSTAAGGGSHSWRTFLAIRKINFHDKGSIWCQRSGWVFPVETETIAIKTGGPPVTVLNEERVSSPPAQVFGEVAVKQRIWGTRHATKGIFSKLKQSDMCLVCIAFASWVLGSSDPQADDAWKAALLANVSALSAIQYLQQYVKNPPPLDNR